MHDCQRDCHCVHCEADEHNRRETRRLLQHGALVFAGIATAMTIGMVHSTGIGIVSLCLFAAAALMVLRPKV